MITWEQSGWVEAAQRCYVDIECAIREANVRQAACGLNDLLDAVDAAYRAGYQDEGRALWVAP